MALERARFEAIDPLATGPAAVRTAFLNQIAYCRDNGASMTARVCDALAGLLEGEQGGTVMARIRDWAGPPLADALPLRIAGGLHALHLSGTEPGLGPVYAGTAVIDMVERVEQALRVHDKALHRYLDGPPQTNEAGRSWAFAAAMLWLVERGCPKDFALFELGSSAGINLMMDRYRYDLGGVSAGPEEAAMRIAPDWRGSPPPNRAFRIVSAEGCDVVPVDLNDPAQALRLRAYIWPELTERFARFDAAVEAASHRPPAIARMRAGDFVAQVLARTSRPGVTRMIMHSVVWQYLAAEERKEITAAIETAGAGASAETPLAWVMLEANRDTHRHELTLRWWPGGPEPVKLATAHPHGSWVEWAA